MKLLVPLDGSVAAQHALDHALWLASRTAGASVILLNVQNEETLGIPDIAARTGREPELALQHAQPILQAACKSCRDAGVPCEDRAEYGPIAEMILRVARQAEADQIVMGTRGLGHLRGFFLGSVASQIVQHAHVPVTLVKESDRQAIEQTRE